MAVAGGFDLHRGQLTFDYVDTGTGESRRGRICPADRESLRGWLRRFDGVPDVEFAVEGCTGGGTWWRNCSGPGSPLTWPSPPRRRACGAASAAPRRTGLMPVIFVALST